MCAKKKETQGDGIKKDKARDRLEKVITKAKEAQKEYSSFSQEQVDKIFHEAAMAANQARIRLAKMAAEETGMGIVEDKVIKNQFAAEYIYNKYCNSKTCDIIEHDAGQGIYKIAEPLGLIAGIVPTTNPTSTAIFKTLLALKTRNGIIFSPHPRAKNCTIEAAKIILEAAVKAGAPEGIIGWIDEPSIELSQMLMQHDNINLILATGGPGMVKSAYSSGTPAIGVGSGNVPSIIDKTADIEMAVSSILLSKTFDNGMICASEQSVIVNSEIYEKVKKEFDKRGAYFVKGPEVDKLRKTVIVDGHVNPKIVGQKASTIAQISGFKAPDESKVLIAEVEKIGEEEPLSHEKLSPVLAMYRAKNFADSVDKASRIVAFGGMGHTSVLYTDVNNKTRIINFGEVMKTGRVLINMPSSQGAIGDVYNFSLEPSLTLGCGSWGGNSIGENVTVKHLINTKTVAERRENMLWFKVPPKIYFKFGCLNEALKDLSGYKRAFIVTDKYLYENGYSKKVTEQLELYDIQSEVFFDVHPNPDLVDVEHGVELIKNFRPDVIIALGGGSPIDAAKILWLMYEHPDVVFEDIAMRFMDIRKRVCKFPKLGKKAKLIAIPTTSGTGSEVTPFAVISDSRKNMKYPIADYELTPSMAIIDPELVLNMPKGLTAASGIDAVSHSLEAMVSVTATEYTNGLALESLQLLFKYLPQSYRDGADNIKAKSKVHHAATIAGMAFANAFLGLCHAMAHQLGGIFHLAHGVANSLLLPHIIRYNASEVPTKQATFPQYTHPYARQRYIKVVDALGLGGKTEDEKIENLIKALLKLQKELDLPQTIIDAGVSEKEFKDNLDELVDRAFDDQCSLTNPRYALFSEIRQLFLKLLKKP
jgi:acetaldehyde dehydrogenase / alcohol dehydrogenase